MIIGSEYIFTWKDIEDCTILLSRDNGLNWEIIAEHVLSSEINESIDGFYEWIVIGPASDYCIIKLIDHSDGEELIGNIFQIRQTELVINDRRKTNVIKNIKLSNNQIKLNRTYYNRFIRRSINGN